MFWRVTRIVLYIILMALAFTGCGSSSPTAVPTPSPVPMRPFACRPDAQTIALGELAWLVATYQDQNPDPNLVAVLDPVWDTTDGNGVGNRPFEDQLWSYAIVYSVPGTFIVKLTRRADPDHTSICQVIVRPRTT